MDTNDHSLYILMISIHGLVRGVNLELGRDADTGGQTRYVIELTRALARRPEVAQVDLITRRIKDIDLSQDYEVPVEILEPKARIIRINAGPESYIAKEDLWEHLDSFTEELYTWLCSQGRRPDVLHSHYADAAYVGVRISQQTGLPLIHTGHSLGRDKKRRLEAMGLSDGEMEEKYRMANRISAEEDALNSAKLVITSTRNEIAEQYHLYDCYNADKMSVIPPGTDLSQFHPPATANGGFAFAGSLKKYLSDPDKPIILALSRPDERKNIIALLKSYGKCKRLQQLANLVIVSGNRNDIRELNVSAKNVLTELLLVIDYHELNGLVAMPKHHQASDVADIYRLAVSSKGVFVNPALTEPFGLTLLEAAASGLPLVATAFGGPVDIIGNCKNGLLVDPLDEASITKAILQILEDKELWTTFSNNGQANVAKFYTWEAHAKIYLEKISGIISPNKIASQAPSPPKVQAIGLGKGSIKGHPETIRSSETYALSLFKQLQKTQKQHVLHEILAQLVQPQLVEDNTKGGLFYGCASQWLIPSKSTTTNGNIRNNTSGLYHYTQTTSIDITHNDQQALRVNTEDLRLPTQSMPQ
jgi:sucrose-phosphate synthase